MQAIAGYLYDQIIDVTIMLDSVPVRENDIMYAKPLQIFKGIDNKFKLQIRNEDQKLQSLLDTSIIFNLMSADTNELVFTRRCIIYSDQKGLAYLVLDRADLDAITTGIFNYSIQLTTGEGKTAIVYSDSNFSAQGKARVVDGVYPQFQASIDPNLGPFYNNNPGTGNFGYSNVNVFFSDIVNVFDRVKTRSVLQTVQYYGDHFTGTVEIQGSMNVAMKESPQDWFTVDTVTFDDLVGCGYSTFTGKIGLVRFKVSTTAGQITKILYRP